MKCSLEKWIVIGNTLVGYLFDSKEFPNGMRVQTGVIRFVDHVNREAHCIDGVYKLCEPGDEIEHNTILPNGVWKRPIFSRLKGIF